MHKKKPQQQQQQKTRIQKFGAPNKRAAIEMRQNSPVVWNAR